MFIIPFYNAEQFCTDLVACVSVCVRFVVAACDSRFTLWRVDYVILLELCSELSLKGFVDGKFKKMKKMSTIH